MEKTKLDIINSATELFKKYGLRSVSIDDVCKELRISKKTFYNFFKQKEELIIQVLENLHEQSKKKTKEPWLYEKDKNIIDVLMEHDKEFRNSSEKDKKHFIMFYDLEKYYPAIFRKYIEAMKKQHLTMVNRLIKHGLSEKVFREDMDVELMSEYLSAQFEAAREFFGKKNRNNYSQIFSFFRDIIVRILVNERGMEYYLKNYYNNNSTE
jgi:AcrR family transcriptional regulator